MLTKDQATGVGESIVDAARQQANDERNASAKRVPWYLSFDELRSLEPFQQAHVIAQAMRQTQLAWSYWLAFAVLVALVGFIGAAMRHELKEAAWLLLPCVFLASFTLRAVFVRARARRLAKEVVASLGSKGGDA
jgi:hypothetical protein